MKRVTVGMTFIVTDENVLRQAAHRGAEESWMQDLDAIIDTDDLGAVIVEALLHSNPGVKSYDEYGLECVDDQTLTIEEN